MNSTNWKPILAFAVWAFAILACSVGRDVVGEESGSSIAPTQAEIGEAQPTEPADEPPVESPTTAPEPTDPPPTEPPPTSASVDVIDTNWYTDSVGIFHFLVLAKNTGDVPLGLVEAVVVLRDDAGNLVATSSGYLGIDTLSPGEIAPADVFFLESPGEWSEFEVTVQGDEDLSFLSTYSELEIVSHTGRVPTFGEYEIIGEIRNIGDKTASFVEVVAILFDAEEKFIGTNFTFASLDKIPPEGTSPFALTILDAAGDVARYELQIEGLFEE